MRHKSELNDQLVSTLIAMRTDVSVVARLYELLYKAIFVAIVESGTEETLDTMSFLICDIYDGTRELPLFTSKDIAAEFPRIGESTLVDIPGSRLWPRLLDVLPDDSCQASVDPTREYGIRLTRAMVLGMIGEYGGSHDAA
jgi:hypothetical protein